MKPYITSILLVAAGLIALIRWFHPATFANYVFLLLFLAIVITVAVGKEQP